MAASLRVGILIDDLEATDCWELRLFEKLRCHKTLELVAFLVGGPQQGVPGQKRQQATSRHSNHNSRLFTLIEKIDERLASKNSACDRESWRAALRNVDVIDLHPCNDIDSTVSHFPPDEVKKVTALKLDVILKHGFVEIEGGLLEAAKFGLWWLQPADDRVTKGEPAGFWETYDKSPVTGITLKKLANKPLADEVIARAFYNVKFSAARNKDLIYEKSIALILRELTRLARDGSLKTQSPEAVGELDADQGQHAGSTQEPRSPGPLQAIHYGAKVGREIIQRGMDTVLAKAGYRPNMWTLFYGQGAFENADLSQTIEAVPGLHEFWGDPFLFTKDNKDYLFFENYNYRQRTAWISVGLIEDGKFLFLGDALKTDYHLSYPFVFEDDGEIYMVPETCNNYDLEVWKCTQFPFEWELYATAFEGQQIVDSIIFKQQDKWWLFTNMTDDPYGDHCSELHIYAIDGPQLNQLTPHELNPVVIDARCSRNGGRVFKKDGKLFRSSQNNSFGVYGYGLNIMEIVSLSLSDYEEKLVKKVVPDFKQGLIACHHMDFTGDHFVIDGCKRFGGFSK